MQTKVGLMALAGLSHSARLGLEWEGRGLGL